MLQKKLEKIRLFAFDVDGVLTDGAICMGAEGELYKAFNAKDGMGISCALKSGLHIALITGRRSDIVRRRAEELGIAIVLEGVKDKHAALNSLAEKFQLQTQEIAYMGDDLNDLPAFRAAGVTFAPGDAVKEVKAAAAVVTSAKGGRGAAREALEMVLEAGSKWQELVAGYLICGQGDKQ